MDPRNQYQMHKDLNNIEWADGLSLQHSFISHINCLKEKKLVYSEAPVTYTEL